MQITPVNWLSVNTLFYQPPDSFFSRGEYKLWLTAERKHAVAIVQLKQEQNLFSPGNCEQPDFQ